MTPAARIQAAIDVLERWRSADEGLDRVLARWGRENRYAGSGDRRAVADLAYDTMRRRRSAAWVAGAGTTATIRDAVIGNLILDGHTSDALTSLFSGACYAPEPLSGIELARLGYDLDTAPRPVRFDFPDWMAPHLASVPDAALECLRSRAPLFLRVNLLRADKGTAISALAADGITAVPGPLSPTCLQVPAGATALTRSRAFRDGLVEVQDAASQAVADFAGAQPGEVVLDYCAGAGGKTLALAAAMAGKGTIHAHDTAPRRLAQLGERAARAGVAVQTHPPGQIGDLAGACDLVLVDAPCSGSGAWRRNPDAKWRLTPERLADMVETQGAVLDAAAAAVGPGGRLVYATCSLLDIENGAVAADFLARQPGFRPDRPALALTPKDGGDGFFAFEFLQIRD